MSFRHQNHLCDHISLSLLRVLYAVSPILSWPYWTTYNDVLPFLLRGGMNLLLVPVSPVSVALA